MKFFPARNIYRHSRHRVFTEIRDESPVQSCKMPHMANQAKEKLAKVHFLLFFMVIMRVHA